MSLNVCLPSRKGSTPTSHSLGTLGQPKIDWDEPIPENRRKTGGGRGEKLGPLLFQFGYFNRRAFCSLGEFLTRLEPFLRGLPSGYRFALEVRNGAGLGEWVEVCNEISGRGVPIFAFANNHYAGNAPATVREFEALWNERAGSKTKPKRGENLRLF